jgi:hypothetical protein
VRVRRAETIGGLEVMRASGSVALATEVAKLAEALVVV